MAHNKFSACEGLVEDINALAAQVQSKPEHESYDARMDLIKAAEQLIFSLRTPEENIYATATRNASNASIRCAINLGAFKTIPIDGTATIREIAAAKNADENLVLRIMRACASTHVFDEVDEGVYAHNAYSKAFIEPTNSAMFAQMYDFIGKGVYAMPEYLESTRWKNPATYAPSAFHLGHHTELGFWEYLNAVPERIQLFNAGMRSKATVSTIEKSVYPFDTELNATSLASDGVALVDVAGGRGQALEKILSDYPNLQGRIILQDQASVIKDAVENGLPERIEAQTVNIFQRNPISGARAYHFRRIFHDWSDQASLVILQNTVAVMDDESRILISDTIVPSRNAPWRMALQDFNMMSFAGMERTEKQWQSLLKSAGLCLHKVWSEVGSMHAIIEARLA